MSDNKVSKNQIFTEKSLEGTFFINGCDLSTDQVVFLSKTSKETKIQLSENAILSVDKGRAILEEKAKHNTPIYGVNTGFGEMVYRIINPEKESELQENLIRSHSAGVGEWLSKEECRAIVIVRLNALSRGYSAIRRSVLDRLSWYLNNNIIPAIPEQGSLGASGDLAPLSHMAVTMLAEGYLYDKDGKRKTTKEIYDRENLTKVKLKFKEGLALVNSTSAMTGLSCLIIEDSLKQLNNAEIIASLSCEILEASSGAFAKEGHDARPHKGQIYSAKKMRDHIDGSCLINSHESLSKSLSELINTKSDVTTSNIFLQKAYTLRCIPEIHGAIYETLWHAKDVINVELNSSDDNPLFFENCDVFHGGNFHGQPISFVMDFCSIALTQLGVISERRTNRLLNKSLNGYHNDFLAYENPGLNSALAGTQYPATSLVAENRLLCSPASIQSIQSIQSIPSNGDNQDVVSMGLISAKKKSSNFK